VAVEVDVDVDVDVVVVVVVVEAVELVGVLVLGAEVVEVVDEVESSPLSEATTTSATARPTTRAASRTSVVFTVGLIPGGGPPAPAPGAWP
jgi:hypothetical protein